jgi:hypothetical protein
MHKLFIIFCFLAAHLQAYEGVSYEFSGGRFGDNLLAYLHAKWISHTQNLPLVYRPFEYSNQLVLDRKGALFRACDMRKFLMVPYFPEDPWEIQYGLDQNQMPWPYFAVDWENPEFRKEVCELVAPKESLQLLSGPLSSVRVAIHFREGGTYDSPGVIEQFPMKFPPFSYYIDALLKVIELFPNKPIFCYLFTDTPNTGYVANRIKHAMPLEANVSFEFRKRSNHWRANVLEDFFSLFQFDILIRPQSNFSLIPSLLHDYAVVFFPEEFSVWHRSVSITKINQKIHPETFAALQMRVSSEL